MLKKELVQQIVELQAVYDLINYINRTTDIDKIYEASIEAFEKTVSPDTIIVKHLIEDNFVEVKIKHGVSQLIDNER